MDLYIYSDESGTFDARHNDYFVFGGLVCIGEEEKEKYLRLKKLNQNLKKRSFF